MTPLVLWPLLIGVASPALPMSGHLIAWIVRILFPAREVISDRAAQASRLGRNG